MEAKALLNSFGATPAQMWLLIVLTLCSTIFLLWKFVTTKDWFALGKVIPRSYIFVALVADELSRFGILSVSSRTASALWSGLVMLMIADVAYSLVYVFAKRRRLI